jgi:hypothetical protein
VTGDIETAVHYRYVEPLLATGRIPSSREVAKQLGIPVEERALSSLADTHGVVLHTHVCEPWVIHPFSASPTATWVEKGERGWWATCMWWTVREAAEIFRKVGLVGDFWEIPVTEGGF